MTLKMTMLSENKELEEIKKIIRSLLLSSKYGLTVNELCSEYNAVTSKVLPYRTYGFSSAIDFIKDMPDVAQPRFHHDGSMFLIGIANQDTAHIRALVHGQKKAEVESRLYSSQQLLANSTRKTVSSFIQGKLHTIIKKYPGGIDLSTFESSYVKEYGKRINPLMQGYTSLKLLLAACPEILTIRMKEDKCMIYPVKEAVIEPQNYMHCITSRGNITNLLKKEVFSVLIKHNHKGGIAASQFLVEFKRLHNKDIDLLKLGYTSVVEFVAKIDDVVHIERINASDWFLSPKLYIIQNNGLMTRSNYQYTTTSVGEVNEQIEICLTYIINPSLFWFQLTMNLPVLNTLMEDMNQFYDSAELMEYILPVDSVVVGQPCAAQYCDNQWYRGVIRKILSENKVQIFYVDYGDSLEVDISLLKVLRTDFLFLPSQGIPGTLNHRRCKGEWTKIGKDKFFALTHDKELVATIICIKKLISIEIMNSDNCNVGHMISKEFIQIQNEESLPILITNNEDIKEIKEVKHESEVQYMLVKCLYIADDYILHIFCHNDHPYIISAEVSGLFWEGDVLKHMLRRKNIELNFDVLLYRENTDLFSTLVRYDVNGILDGNKSKQSISCYKLIDLTVVFSFFSSIFSNALELVTEEIALWQSNSLDYWKKDSRVIFQDEEKDDLFNRLKDLELRRKKLFQNMVMNRGADGAMLEIMTLDKEIASLKL